jgi:hypothetical protein
MHCNASLNYLVSRSRLLGETTSKCCSYLDRHLYKILELCRTIMIAPRSSGICIQHDGDTSTRGRREDQLAAASAASTSPLKDTYFTSHYSLFIISSLTPSISCLVLVAPICVSYKSLCNTGSAAAPLTSLLRICLLLLLSVAQPLTKLIPTKSTRQTTL